MSRTTNSLRNVGSAVTGQLLNNLLRFACRTVFLHTLGKEYLGISSLYSNVLTILSISELGFGTAVTYSLYEPLAQGDTETVAALMGYFRKAYRVIAAAVLTLGLALMPWLPNLMTGVTDKVNIYHYYLLYLGQTVISYLFFSYKSVLLTADQKKYVADLVSYGCQIAMNLAQMLVLVVWRSFLAYTLLGLFSNAAQNLITAVLADRRYPFLRGKAPKLSRERRRDLFRRVYAMALNRFSTAVGTATDNLIISGYVGVVAVGLYNNYDMIQQVVKQLLSGVFRALTASVGNLYASRERERSAFLFRSLNLLNNYLVCLCSVCFLVLFQPFIILWAGADYLLSVDVVAVIVLNFATNYLQNVVQVFREAVGTFVRGKYRPVATAVLNLVLSLILVQRLGIAGVFWGSILSRLVTTWWYDAWMLCRSGFGVSPAGYYRDCAVVLLLAALSAAAIEALTGGLAVGWGSLILRLLLSAALVSGAYLLIYGRTPEAGYLREQAEALLKRKRK